MIIYALLGIIVILLAALALVFLRKPADSGQPLMLMQQQLEGLRAQLSDSLNKNTESLNRQLNSITEQVNGQLSTVTARMVDSQKIVGDRLDNAARVVADVQKSLGSLGQATDRIYEVGKDIASLQEILKAPKLRGTLGELFLGDLLSQMLVDGNYTLQHRFKSGETVDAVINIGKYSVPVDSKFPLENFRRIVEAQNDADKKAARKKFVTDVKKHIDAISTKYILHDEGTFDFALMYIPAENVYYETIIRDENSGEAESISTYALSKKVIPVSPNSFYAYLQAIILGLRGMKIEKSAQEIIKQLARLKGDFERFNKEFEILGGHITNIKNKYDEAAKRLGNFNDKLTGTGESDLEKLPVSGTGI